MKNIIYFIISIGIMTLIIQSCAAYYFRSNYADYNSLIHETNNLNTKPFLKAHLKNGDICIFQDTWKIDSIFQTVNGECTQFNINRNKIFDGNISIPIDSVAIFETNHKIKDDRVSGLALLAGLDVILGIVCITVPKACFGSCPTFYLKEHDNFHSADAEGFSNAISPSLEYADVDAINNPIQFLDTFTITMKNEALETHCIKDINILAYPIKEGERIYHTPTDEFFLCQNMITPTNATANEGDILELIKFQDKVERFSFSDETNLSSKEEIDLTFDSIQQDQDLGLILHFRQTLMTTYFIYSALGYMGDEIGDFFSKIETDKKVRSKLESGIKKELGNIEIYTWDEEKNIWRYQHSFYETGPIALNKQFMPLNQSSVPIHRIKLVLNTGLWRIDYAALTHIRKKVTPIEIKPCLILNKGTIDTSALNSIHQSGKHLISMPGAEFKFKFKLPNNQSNYELFLYSKGYYLEWMRGHWLKDKNLLKLKQMMYHPVNYLKEEAGNYKTYEHIMEQEFWNSKIDTKTFSYYEN